MRLLLKNTKGNYNKEEKQEEDNINLNSEKIKTFYLFVVKK